MNKAGLKSASGGSTVMSKAGLKSALGGSTAGNGADSIDWELRPGGMLVQKRDPNTDTLVAGPMIKLKVSYGLSLHEVKISPQATFGDLKKLLAQETSLQPNEQRLLFRGKEKDNFDYLHVAGVKEKSKIILVEDTASRERRLLETRRNNGIARACKIIADVKQEVDKLAEQVSTLEAALLKGSKVADNDFAMLTEKLMCQVLRLDGIKADGDAKTQRRIQIRRIQTYVESLDVMKARNATPGPRSSTVVTTNWETFEIGVAGSLNKPPPTSSASTVTDWELFD